MTRVLLTGFAPFDGESTNPSWRAVRAAAAEPPAGIEMSAAGLPASVSNTAGTFVCNHVFYGLAHLIATELPGIRGGFVHVPYAPEQVLDRAEPSLPTEAVTRALREIALTAARTRTDIRVAGGATH
ncbi:hypothetical protein [Streptomyces tubercidicus]|uniref:pyroglutamyl-peptidase I family protein n=1 Tax=Streptomyces tubercidicus TaxID=47759 RepID=UPI003465BBC7